MAVNDNRQTIRDQTGGLGLEARPGDRVQALRTPCRDSRAQEDQQRERQKRARQRQAPDPVERRHVCRPHRADRQADEDRDVVRVVAEGFYPAPERGLLILQPRDLPVAPVENAGGERQECSERRRPGSARG